MNSITVNGVTIQTNAKNVCVRNGLVIVDGSEIRLGSSYDVKIDGNVGSLVVPNGRVEVTGSVSGDVNAGGSVNCGDIGGNLDAGGSVNCKNAKQNIDAGGSVSVRG